MVDSSRGEPIQIYGSTSSRRYIELDKVSAIFSRVPDNYQLTIVAINGEKRKGKSFLLNKIIQRLSPLQDSATRSPSGPGNNGFLSTDGANRGTVGIWAWSQPILLHAQQIAIIFLDTEGNFDCESNFMDNVLVYAIAVRVSSLLIYNISSDISEDQLQYLQFFTNFAADNTSTLYSGPGDKFQHLLYLVRDWAWPTDSPFGISTSGNQQSSGSNYAQKFFSRTLDENSLWMRNDISSHFNKTSFYLIPHPGLSLLQQKSSTGRKQTTQEFDHQLTNFVSTLQLDLLKPALTKSQVLSELEYWKNALEHNSINEIKNFSQIRAEVKLQMAIGRFEKRYHEKMREIACTCNTSSSTSLRQAHEKLVGQFETELEGLLKNIPSSRSSSGYRTQMRAGLEELYNMYVQMKESQMNQLKYVQEKEKLATDLQALQSQVTTAKNLLQEKENELVQSAAAGEDYRMKCEQDVNALQVQIEQMNNQVEMMSESNAVIGRRLASEKNRQGQLQQQVIRVGSGGGGGFLSGVFNFLGGILQATTTFGKVITAFKSFGGSK